MALLALGYQIDTCEPQMRAVRQGKIKLHALTKGHYPGVKLSSDVMPGLNSIGFWDGIGAQDWGLDEHRNEGVKSVCWRRGNGALRWTNGFMRSPREA